MEKTEWVEVDAELSVWRVFGLQVVPNDPPENGWKQTEHAGPQVGDTTTVEIGDVPADLLEAVRDFRAQLPMIVKRMVGEVGTDVSWSDQEAEIDEERGRVDLTDIRGKIYRNWLTFRVSRPLKLLAQPDRMYQWLGESDYQLLGDFAAEAFHYIDYTIAHLACQLNAFGIATPLFAEQRTFVTTPGRRAFALPRRTLTIAAGGLQIGTGWANLPVDSVEARLASLSAGSPSRSVVTSAARWYTLALAEDNDPLRRFFFAFFGIEVLVNKVSKQTRSRVVDQLQSELGGLPLTELVWPSPSGDDAPWRSLMFNFACSVIAIRRESPTVDVDTFRNLQKARNSVAHGGGDDLGQLPATECLALLGQLLGYAADAEAAGVLG